MKRKRQTIRQKAERYDSKFLLPVTALTEQGARDRVKLAYWAGYEAGQRAERLKYKRKL